MTPDQVRWRRSQDLLEAARWGFDGTPETLAAAIQRLSRYAASPSNPTGDSRREADEAKRKNDASNLMSRLIQYQNDGLFIQSNTESNSMKITDAFPSNYLKAADLNGRAVKVTIADCQLEHLDDEQKPVIRFQGKQKGMVLNRTNAGVIAAALGEETGGWVGREVELYPDRTMFQGRMVDCLRVRVPAPPAPTAGADSDVPW